MLSTVQVVHLSVERVERSKALLTRSVRSESPKDTWPAYIPPDLLSFRVPHVHALIDTNKKRHYQMPNAKRALEIRIPDDLSRRQGILVRH